MRPIQLSEIKNIAEYEIEREALRPRMIALKDRRRIAVGDHLTLLFENRETVRYQIQEMMRIERMVKPEEMAREVETYNELIPDAGELSATLLIEFEDAEERKVRLRELLGLENHMWLVAGDQPPAKARFDTRQIATDRISSVQYLKFKLSPEQALEFKTRARIVVDHPAYNASRELTDAEREELAREL